MNVQDTAMQAKEFVETQTDEANAVIRQHPASSMLIAFSAGLGVGLVATSLLIKHTVPDASFTERMGRQMWDAMGNAMPNDLLKSFRQ